MKFGLHLDSTGAGNAAALYAQWSEQVQLCDAAGFKYVSVVDHLVPFPGFKPVMTPLFDAWQMLTAFAVQTTNVTLLTLVHNAPLSHPVRLAKQAATLDVISQGRMMLGLGAGGYPADDAALNLIGRSQQERYARLSESIEIVRSLWRGQAVSFRGAWYELDEIHSSPVPGRDPELLLAGRSDAILRLVAQHGDACNFAFLPEDGIIERVSRLASLVQDTPRTLQDIEVSVLDRIYIGRSENDALKSWRDAGAPKVNDHAGLVGSAENLISRIHALQQAGVETLFCMFPDLSALQLFAVSVLPQFAGNQDVGGT